MTLPWSTCKVCSQELRVSAQIGFCNECFFLVDKAVEALSVARTIGVPRYGPSSWRDVPVQEHLEHASKHIYNARKQAPIRLMEGMIINDDEDHIAHAICRLVMARALTA